MRRGAWNTFGVFSFVLLASAILPLPAADGRIGHIPAFCPFYRLTGLPCPGCGLTRAFVCLGHGHLAASLHWHPVGWLLYGLCLLLWLRAGATLAGGRPFLPLSPQMIAGLSVAGVTGLLLVGTARIAWMLANHLTL